MNPKQQDQHLKALLVNANEVHLDDVSNIYSYQKEANIVSLTLKDLMKMTSHKDLKFGAISIKRISFNDINFSALTIASWGNLRHLSISGCNLTAESMLKLSKSSWDLETISIKDCFIGDQGASCLSTYHGEKLLSLELVNNRITSLGFETLATSRWRKIKTFIFILNTTDSQAMKAFSENVRPNKCCCPSLVDNPLKWLQIKQLQLIYTSINDLSLKFMVRIPWKITSLNLLNNHITSEGLVSLVKADWSDLESLNLQRNIVGGEATRTLVHGNWKKMRILLISQHYKSTLNFQKMCLAQWPLLETMSLISRTNLIFSNNHRLEVQMKNKFIRLLP